MSKETQLRNRELVKYIRKGLSIQEDFVLQNEGYRSLLEKTNQLLKDQNRIDLSREKKKALLKDVKRINSKVKKWRLTISQRIKENPSKYLPIFFFKWLGIDNIYTTNTVHHRYFSYRGHSIKGTAILQAVRDRYKYVQQVQKATNKARALLMEENMALIHQQARKVAGERKDIIDDLVSVAYQQFILCMDSTYDPTKGTEFSTYAASCMYHQCREAKIKYDEIIRVPTARMKDKTSAAKGELDLECNDIKNEKKKKQEILIRNTISNSNMYWSLDRTSDENSEDDNISDSLLSDGNYIDEQTDQILLQNTIDRITNKIIQSEQNKKTQRTKIKQMKALEYSGDLDFLEELGENTLKTVASMLLENGYTKHLITAERARQLINGGKKLIRNQIVADEEFMEVLGMAQEA